MNTFWKRTFKVLKFLTKSSLLLGMTGFLIAFLYIASVLSDTPTVNEPMLLKATANSSNIYDKNGNILFEFLDKRRDYLKLSEYPKTYLDFIISTEDNEYYESPGYSIKGITNAAISLAKEKILKEGQARGGSTLEQQLIKNLVFSTLEKDKTIERKIKELWLSIQINKNFSKEQILEWYVNMIFLGENSYGANTISKTYYGKSISEFKDKTPENISKMAIIAGLGQSPSLYNLYDNPQAVEERRNIIIDLAVKNKKINKDDAEKAKAVPVVADLKERQWRATENNNRISRHPAFLTSVFNQISELGYDVESTPLQVYTTLDPEVDGLVKDIFDTYWGYQPGQQIAGTVIDPNTGYVMAQYGGIGSKPFELNRATQTNRSSGSSIKPFLSYGPLLEYVGYGSETTYDSSPYVYPGTSFVANNYGGAVYGMVSMSKSLKLSLNTPAIRILDQMVGSANAKEFLSKINLDVKEYYGGQDALGLNISTEQLAGAFATLANYGKYKKPQFISKITFEDNSTKEIKFEPVDAMRESTAYILLKMLQGVPKADGTAIHAQLPYTSYSVKTGTVGYDNSIVWTPALAASDSWIGGTTKNVSLAIWSGFDKPYEPGNYLLENNESHQHVFRIIMERLNRGKDTRSDWVRPNTVVNRNGLSPTDVTKSAKALDEAVFVDNTNSKQLADLSKFSKTNILDGGMPSYPVPDNAQEIIDWQNKADTDMVNKWKANPGSALYGLSVDEDVSYDNGQE